MDLGLSVHHLCLSCTPRTKYYGFSRPLTSKIPNLLLSTSMQSKNNPTLPKQSHNSSLEILDFRPVEKKTKQIPTTLLKYKPIFWTRNLELSFIQINSMSLEAAVRKTVPAYHFLIEYPIQSFCLFFQIQIKLAKAQTPSLRHKFNYNKAVAACLIRMLFYTFLFTF